MPLNPAERREHAAYLLAHVYEQRRAGLAAIRTAVRMASDAGMSFDEIVRTCDDDSTLVSAMLNATDSNDNGQESLPF